MGYEEMAADGGYGKVGSDENRRMAEQLEQADMEESYRMHQEEAAMEAEMEKEMIIDVQAKRIAELEVDIVGYNYANQILMDKIEKIVDALVQGIKDEKIENSLAVEIGKIISSDETGTP